MKRSPGATGWGRFGARKNATAGDRLARASAAAMVSEALEARLFLSATVKAAAIGTPAAGYGLLAHYYPSSDFTGTPVDRIDRSVNFAWGRGGPMRGMPGGAFSVQWTGNIVAPRTGTFTFTLTSLGGGHLIVNGADVINDLGASIAKPTTDTGTVDMVAGQSYSLELDYIAGGRASASLRFAGPRLGRQVIPSRDLLSGMTPPQAPGGLSAQVASSSEVDLSWQPNGSSLTGFTVQRAVGKGAYATIAHLGGTVTGYQDTRVRPNTSYTYRVIASNITGSSLPSAPLAARTLPPGVTPIDASANVAAASAIFLAWATPSAASNVTGYAVERSVDGAKAWTSLGTVDVNTTSYSDTSAADGHTYTYLITAMNGSAVSPFVGTTSVTIPLATPSGLAANVLDPNTVQLSWTNQSTSATGFEIDRSLNGGLTWTLLQNVAAGTTSVNTAVVPGQNYAYEVRATMGANNTSTFSNVAALAGTLGAPANVAATVNSPNSVTINWNPVGSGQTGYEIDRSTDGGATWPTMFTAAANATSYTDTTALGAAGYTYRVRALAGTSTSSPFSTSVAATTPLAAPGNVTATALTASAVMLNWADTNLGETGYEVDRSPDGSSSWSALATLSPGSTTYTDTNLSFSTTYYYRVTALGPAAATAPSPTTTATTAASDAPQYLLTPSTLTTLQQEAANNTPQWQAFKANLDAGLNTVTIGAYEGDQLPSIGDYAMGYQILRNTDPTTAASYADKAIALMTAGLDDNLKGDWASQMLLSRGDGSTTQFTLPNTGINGPTVSVWLAPVTTAAITKGTANGQDSVGYYEHFLKVSTTPDGATTYVDGTDWQHNPNYDNNYIDWSLASSNQPTTGSTYYITESTALNESTATGWTLSGNVLTFATPPTANQAIFVQYQYTDTSTGLKYQQSGDGTGGFNNVFIDDDYTTRNLQYIAIGLDWLWSYQGLSPSLRTAASSMLVRWSNYLVASGYKAYAPASNYGEAHFAFRVATAIALTNRNAAAPQLKSEVVAYHQNYVVPLFQAPANGWGSEQGGFWGEGWNYGSPSIQYIVTSAIALQDMGWASITAESTWANDVITSLLEEQPTQSTIYDGGDGYAWPRTFPDNYWGGKALLEETAYIASNATTKSYANWAIKNLAGTSSGWADLFYRDPNATAAYWGNTGLPLQYLSSGTGLVVSRKDWTYASTWLAFQDGDLVNADHQTYAQGALEINRGADALLVDANSVGEQQTPWVMSVYANLVAINDNGAGIQRWPGSQGLWPGQDGNPPAQINHFDGTADFTYVQGDYRGAEGNQSGQNPTTEMVRDVFYVRGADYVIVYDRATTTQANFKKQLQWHFNATPVVSGDSWVESVGSSKLFGQTFSDVPLTTREQAVTVGNATVQQIATNNASPIASVRYLTAMQVTSSAVAAMDSSTHVESADGQVDGVQMGSYVVMFGKKGRISGGESYQVTTTAGIVLTHYVSDLTPGATYNLVGANMASATADSQGVLSFTTTGTGSAQTIAFTPA